ncbi:phage holin [Staphylococcus pseudintermedius]|uniref:phage holin n=1 Tax=Staphylococcus pseudintermedius TaxID=283734 RepID=UPI000C1BE2DA|nr:phage holin [Staphylococcus pseudintermedius]EGQ0291273.1 phage holin [Staphylococcus pseudintermedius]EGQ2772268.1 phage holin [Staphylococcus pseudintermedius]EGQ3812301.1 phage holin [Staphylococcus pseudintermedius]EGQ4414878.1 phage holin [Staphylococcus pseudintermedius]EGQ4460361.1 phage holin [Staphylococcus pseudintermedius]
MNKSMVLRTAVLILALVNQWLANHNMSPLPTTEDDLNTLILTGAALWTWYKDNPVSKEAKWANQKLKKYKAEKKFAKATGQAPIKQSVESTNPYDDMDQNI